MQGRHTSHRIGCACHCHATTVGLRRQTYSIFIRGTYNSLRHAAALGSLRRGRGVQGSLHTATRCGIVVERLSDWRVHKTNTPRRSHCYQRFVLGIWWNPNRARRCGAIRSGCGSVALKSSMVDRVERQLASRRQQRRRRVLGD